MTGSSRTLLLPFVTLIFVIGSALASAAENGEDANAPARVSVDPNEFRWDLARGFEFDWESVKLSAEVFRDGSPDAKVLTCAISMRVKILDDTGLVTIDVNRPAIFEALDDDGRMVEYLPDTLYPVRLYEKDGWWWDSTGGHAPKEWHGGTLLVRLPVGASEPMPSLLSRVTGYIHVLYGEIVDIDVPFDAQRGVWLDFAAAPDLLFRVDSRTPPPPGPIPDEPAPIALYKYRTWVKSLSGQPVMAVRDVWPWFPRHLHPFGDHAIVRVELFDSQREVAACLPREWEYVLSAPVGSYLEGARCWGQKEQNEHAFDMIRHVIVVAPVEVRVPFVLTDIPIPTIQPPGK